jgi:hypothetical protein
MKTLEGSKVFPYLAWMCVAIMVFATASLVHSLKGSLQELDTKTHETATTLQKQ